MEICEQQSEIGMRHVYAIPIYGYVGQTDSSVMGVANYFVGQSIGVDEKNTFQYIFNFLSSIISSMKIVDATGFCGLWAHNLHAIYKILTKCIGLVNTNVLVSSIPID